MFKTVEFAVEDSVSCSYSYSYVRLDAYSGFSRVHYFLDRPVELVLTN